MALNFSQINLAPATGAAAVWAQWLVLQACGATKTQDSDGTTRSATGLQVTGSGAGAHGLANNLAYVVLKSKQGRQWCIQRSATDNTLWRVKYSYAAGFIGGAPSATQVPAAADEQTLLGSGTDAAPNFSTWFATDATYKFSAVADDAGPTFYSFAYPNGGGTPSHQWMVDPIDPLRSSVYTSADVDPVVQYCSGAAGNVWTTNFLGSGFGYWGAGTWSTALNVVVPSFRASNSPLGTDPANTKEFGGFPVFYYQVSQQPKGWGSTWTFHCHAQTTPGTCDIVTAKDFIVIGDAELPWNGSTPA